jgi:hypothetical protein
LGSLVNIFQLQVYVPPIRKKYTGRVAISNTHDALPAKDVYLGRIGRCRSCDL